jgi:hypothetical protein
MKESFLSECARNQINLSIFLEQSCLLSAESYQLLMRLLLTQEWLADLETRAVKLAETVRTQTH